MKTTPNEAHELKYPEASHRGNDHARPEELLELGIPLYCPT